MGTRGRGGLEDSKLGILKSSLLFQGNALQSQGAKTELAQLHCETQMIC